MMTPTLVESPTEEPMSLTEMKIHLRVDGDDEDDLISQLMKGAVAHLDGWKGVLGRCIMPQTWSVEAITGKNVLPFPDVTAARVDGALIDVTMTALGSCVEVSEAAVVEFDCALPEADLERVKIIVKLLVGHWFQNREAAGDPLAEIPFGVEILCSALKWRAV